MSTEATLALVPPIDDRPPRAVNAAERLAAEVDELIDEIAVMIPRLETPHPLNSKDARAAHTVSRDFIMLLISAAKEEPELERFGFFDANDAREVLEFNDAFRPIAHRLEILLAGIKHTMASRKAKIAIGAMNTYMTAKRYARKPSGARFGPYVEKLRHALGRTNRPRAARRQA